MRLIAAFLIILWAVFPAHAGASAWCGYALIEGIAGIESALPIMSLLAPDESRDSKPDELFQVRVSLDGTKAIIEACWRIFPSKEVVLNLLTLGGNEKEQMELNITYSLFAPGGKREESAASVRDYLMKNIGEWELPEDQRGAETK